MSLTVNLSIPEKGLKVRRNATTDAAIRTALTEKDSVRRARFRAASLRLDIGKVLSQEIGSNEC